MARPRKYRHLTNDRCRLADHDFAYVPDSLFQQGYGKLFAQTTRERWREQAGWARRGRNRYYHLPTVNGYNDPLSIMLVFDCMMRLETTSILQANTFTRILVDHYTQVRWDQITVGKILAGLATVTDDRGNPDFPPLTREKSNGVVYYVVSDHVRTREWMGRGREWLGEQVGKYIADYREGVPNTLPLTIYDDLGNLE